MGGGGGKEKRRRGLPSFFSAHALVSGMNRDAWHDSRKIKTSNYESRTTVRYIPETKGKPTGKLLNYAFSTTFMDSLHYISPLRLHNYTKSF